MITVKPKNINAVEFRRTLSNILKIFFVVFQIIFGYDFGFIKYKSTRHKFIIKLSFAAVPFVSGIAFILTILPDCDTTRIMWYLIFIMECYSYIVTLLLASEHNTFQNFLSHLLWIDSELKVDNSSYYLELKIILCCVISLMWTIGTGIKRVTFYSCLYARITYFGVFLPINIPFVILFFIFLAANIRLTALRKSTNIEPKKVQVLYKSLIESVENVKKPFNIIIFVSLCTNIPTIMKTIYQIVGDFKATGLDNLYNNSLGCASSAVFLLEFFAPALAAGALSTEVEKIKINLNDTLLLEKDENRVQDIKRFLRYIEARPFKLTVLQIIPLDASFMVTVLNFSVTYLIVILQLTHTY